jgi:tetratricopeptide (TPR) repeat protein
MWSGMMSNLMDMISNYHSALEELVSSKEVEEKPYQLMVINALIARERVMRLMSPSTELAHKITANFNITAVELNSLVESDRLFINHLHEIKSKLDKPFFDILRYMVSPSLDWWPFFYNGEMADNSLNRAISDYENSIDSISNNNAGQNKDSFQSVVLKTLVNRDKVDELLSNSAKAPPEELKKIATQDQRLKELAIKVDSNLGQNVLNNWREITQRTRGWWWSLDELAAINRSKLWTFFSWFCIAVLAVSVSYMIEIVRRLFSSDVNIPIVVFQGFLTLIVGKAIIQFGSDVIEGASGKGIVRRFQQQWKSRLGFTLLVAISAFVLFILFPSIVRYYNNQGATDYSERKIASAINNYKRALSLQPNQPNAHYNIGNSYALLLQYDKAIEEYQQAIEKNDKYCEAYISLAQLYISRRNDYTNALNLLQKVVNLRPDNNVIQYALNKNLGWAHIGLKHFDTAQKYLETAVSLNPERAEAYCLMKKLFDTKKEILEEKKKKLEEKKKTPEILLELSKIEKINAELVNEAASKWEKCFAYSPNSEGIEAEWLIKEESFK